MYNIKELYETVVQFTEIENRREKALKELNEASIQGVKVKARMDTLIEMSGKSLDELQTLVNAYSKTINKEDKTMAKKTKPKSKKKGC